MTQVMAIAEIEDRLDYRFGRKELLEEALTHSSFAAANYERLEFLGDRVLGMVIGNWLWERFAGADEGELSRRFTGLVRESTLASVARGWGLDGAIRLGPGEASKPSILADVVEAVLGAVWVDGGLAAVDGIVRRAWADIIDLKDEKDPKTRLQEWLQGQGLGLPVYEVVDERGPDHDKHFSVQVKTARGDAEGQGRTKQLASADAARALMKRLES